MQLNANALGKENLFDLERRTLRFVPHGAAYTVSNEALKWDADFGAEIQGSQVTLHNFAFPFSDKKWNAFSVASNGAVTFGSTGDVDSERRGGSFPIARFDQLANAAPAIANTVPGICVFLKPRMSGHRYVKELTDRVVITWDIAEPRGGIQDFTWKPTVNRFQAVLAQDGSIEMSYDHIAARDAIVGIYPIVKVGKEKAVASLPGAATASVAPYLEITNLKIAVVDDLFLKVTFETRGTVLPEGNPALAGVSYRVYFSTQAPGATTQTAGTRLVWTAQGFGRPGRGGASRYIAFGPGLSHQVIAIGNTISIQGIVPALFTNARNLYVSADALAPGAAESAAVQVKPRVLSFSGLRSPEVRFSSLNAHSGPFTIVYEAFHYLALPDARDLSCTVISGLGDKFDFLAYYSDFRIDNQEAGTPSNGPLGGNVTGIGQTMKGLESYCSAGRFQWEFIQPVYVGSNQMQEFPPPDIKTNDRRDIDFYESQLREASPGGQIKPYDLAMSQIGHEMGHRWSAFVSAEVNGERVVLGPTHWARGLQAPVPFPFQRPAEASAMGGGVWQDNFDGTFTQLDDDYYVPATGYSYLDLYLMGLITPSEVPDFFLLRNLLPAGHDSYGHPIFKADRVKVTVGNVIAAEGPRLPAVAQSQRKFNTGMVLVVEHGKEPSHELMERTSGIARAWIDYWSTVTGRRSSMTTDSH